MRPKTPSAAFYYGSPMSLEAFELWLADLHGFDARYDISQNEDTTKENSTD